MVYLEETKQILKFRIDDHCGYVINSIDTATRSHFIQPGNSLAKIQVIQVTAIEQTKQKQMIMNTEKNMKSTLSESSILYTKAATENTDCKDTRRFLIFAVNFYH